MGREVFLRVLDREEALSTLSIDALKLYILFILSTDGSEGMIDSGLVKRAFGKDFCFKRLSDACIALMVSGLAHIDLIGLDGSCIWDGEEPSDFVLRFNLFGR